MIAIFGFYIIYNRNLITPTSTNTSTTGTTGFTPLNPSNTVNTRPINISSSTLATPNINTAADTKKPIVRQLVADPVTSAISTSTPRGVVVRYIDRASGHIFEINPDTSNSVRITNTTIPKVLSAKWSTGASDILMTYIRNNNTEPTDLYLHIDEVFPTTKTPAKKITAGQATTTSSSTPVQTATLLTTKSRIFGTGNIFTTISPSGDKTFYLSGEGVTLNGYMENFKTNELSKIWSSSISSWVANWVKDTAPAKIALYIKPISIGTGFGYLFDPSTKSFDKVGQGGKGFTMNVNRSATYAVTATTEGNTINTDFVNIKTAASTIAPLRTMPEKCAWGMLSDKVVYCAVPNDIKQYEYPDAWYMGEVSFIDSLWKINVETGEVTRLANLLNETDELIDAIDISVAPGDQYLTFINKNDLSLWMLDLSSKK